MKQDNNNCQDLGNLMAIKLHNGYTILVRSPYQHRTDSYRLFFYLQKKGIRHVFEIDDPSNILACPKNRRSENIRRLIAGFVEQRLKTGYFLPYMEEFEEELKEAI